MGIPQARFLPAKYVTRDDEFSEDIDIESMRCESIGCPLVEYLATLGL